MGTHASPTDTFRKLQVTVTLGPDKHRFTVAKNLDFDRRLSGGSLMWGTGGGGAQCWIKLVRGL